MLDQLMDISVARQPGDEPIPGYRLTKKLGGGGFGEVWKCTAPGGLAKAIKFINIRRDGSRVDDWAACQELGAIEQVKTIRHPFLLGLDRVEFRDDELLMVMELADQTLQDLFNARRQEGLPGIPVGELIPIASEASEALDLLAEHGLQHLDVKPGNVMLVGGHAKVGDFGLVGAVGFHQIENNEMVVVTAKYVAPEVLGNTVTEQSDQYGFALVVYELLTGQFPYTCKSSSQMMMMHLAAEPDLSAVNSSAAEVFSRALCKNPADRFPSCREFVANLATALSPDLYPGATSYDPAGASRHTPPYGVARLAEPAKIMAMDTVRSVRPSSIFASIESLPLTREFDEIGQPVTKPGDLPSIPYLVQTMIRASLLSLTDVTRFDTAEVTDLFCRFPVRASRVELVKKLAELATELRGKLSVGPSGEFLLAVEPRTGWLTRLLDRPAPIQLVIALPDAEPGEVTAVAWGSGGATDQTNLEKYAFAVDLLHFLRDSLIDNLEQRKSVRYPTGTPIMIYPVNVLGQVSAGIEGKCVDLSDGGCRLKTATRLSSEHYYVRFLHQPTADRVGVLCSLVRRVKRTDHLHEIGCRFSHRI